MIGALILALAASAATPPAPQSYAFLTFESGRLAAVDWVDRDGLQLHSRSILTQSCVLDATIELREDETVVRTSVVFVEAGKNPEPPVASSFGEGTIYWSDMMASSIEQAVLRAHVLNHPSARIPAAPLFGVAPGEVEVERLDATDWTVRYHNKRYEVLTDSSGHVISAALPDFGVTIERRVHFAPEQ